MQLAETDYQLDLLNETVMMRKERQRKKTSEPQPAPSRAFDMNFPSISMALERRRRYRHSSSHRNSRENHRMDESDVDSVPDVSNVPDARRTDSEDIETVTVKVVNPKPPSSPKEEEKPDMDRVRPIETVSVGIQCRLPVAGEERGVQVGGVIETPPSQPVHPTSAQALSPVVSDEDEDEKEEKEEKEERDECQSSIEAITVCWDVVHDLMARVDDSVGETDSFANNVDDVDEQEKEEEEEKSPLRLTHKWQELQHQWDDPLQWHQTRYLSLPLSAIREEEGVFVMSARYHGWRRLARHFVEWFRIVAENKVDDSG